ncbi:hypothetical protein [Turicimonas muris]|uniref:hypothetical protein n=1 Tax=Turicimonas muris TaxID=1796652 RepID=UPI0024959231|nr:hypothetical protein [Turicimonas muris]
MTKFENAKEVESWVKEVNLTFISIYENNGFYHAEYMSLADKAQARVEYAGNGLVLFDGEEVDPLYAEAQLDRQYEQLDSVSAINSFSTKKEAIEWAKEHFNAEDEDQLEQMKDLIDEIRKARKH